MKYCNFVGILIRGTFTGYFSTYDRLLFHHIFHGGCKFVVEGYP